MKNLYVNEFKDIPFKFLQILETSRITISLIERQQFKRRCVRRLPQE